MQSFNCFYNSNLVVRIRDVDGTVGEILTVFDSSLMSTENKQDKSRVYEQVDVFASDSSFLFPLVASLSLSHHNHMHQQLTSLLR
jgi:hypothetical protein